MKRDNERGRDAEPAGEVREAAEAARTRLRTRAISEEIVAAIPAGGETVAAAPAERPRLRTRVISEAVVAAFSVEGGAAEGGAGGGAGG